LANSFSFGHPNSQETAIGITFTLPTSAMHKNVDFADAGLALNRYLWGKLFVDCSI